MTSRELVIETLEFRNFSDRVPHQLWTLPWSTGRYGDTIKRILREYPDDIVNAPNPLKTHLHEVGNPFAVGRYTDPFGTVFQNLQYGVVGEAKEYQILDDDWSDSERIRIPEEYLTLDVDAVNAFCHSTDNFVIMGVCPRPFERLQFLRGTENLLMDLADPPQGFFRFAQKLHDFNCRVIELWASKTDIDAIIFMDDWGTQNAPLIHPKIWERIFKPMYRDFICIAHQYGKKAFMHSDGNILPMMPHFVELGLDAINVQIGCMGTDKLQEYAGKITFWGEVDPQRVLPFGTKADVDAVIDDVYRNLWRNGGCIAQCEFGPAANPENVKEVYRHWQSIRA